MREPLPPIRRIDVARLALACCAALTVLALAMVAGLW